ncbi:MAG TPA: hypothetical protein VIM69_04225, partial [Opitutaceae bacterium]
GTPFVGRMEYLRTQPLIPLAQLFSADQNSKVYFEEQHTGVFYAESWAFVHYLHFGHHDFSSQAVERFLKVALDREKLGRVNLEAEFNACFGCDYRQMERRLNRYIMTGSYSAYGVLMPKLPSESSYPVRPVPVGEARLRLAELALRVLQSGLGELTLLNAESAKPVDPRVFEALGANALRKGDDHGAEGLWEQALIAGSKNPAIVRELGLLEGRRWFQQFNQNLLLPEEVTTRLRERLKRSISLEPLQGASFEMLAWVEAFSRVPDADNVKLVTEHITSISDKRRTIIALCQLMIRTRQTSSAQMLLHALEQKTLTPADQGALGQLYVEYNALKDAVAPGEAGDAPDEPKQEEHEAKILPPEKQDGALPPSVQVPDKP